MVKYDFGGWATKNDLPCSDGRTIRKDAFKGNSGQIVPLVWNHQHDEASDVLGHAMLENRDEGVYAFCSFNDSESGKAAKEAVVHGDIRSLSIFANKLQEAGKNVIHGIIREVSLVMAGANPGAFIDNVMVHGDDESSGMIVGYDESLDISHSEEDPITKKEDDVIVEEKPLENALEHAKATDPKATDDKTTQDVIDSMTDEQQTVMYAMVGLALEDAAPENGGDNNMEQGTVKHNLFEGKEGLGAASEGKTLSHAEMETIIKDAKRSGSLKDSFLAHADTYGITNIDYMFPDAQAINAAPDFVTREMAWVAKVMASTHHTPFSRIKSMSADITEDEARAKGYIKGSLKKEEVFSLLKRTTTPTTIYKKQKLDRDDIVDITDFDVVAWLKTEMRMMLDEEIARAILIGDGRLSSSDDKILAVNIRPIWTDEALYTVKATVTYAANDTDDMKAKNFIRTAIKSRKLYKGSGNPALFTTEDVVTDCLLIEDTTGRRIYNTVQDLATALRVSDVITVEPITGSTRIGTDTKVYTLLGIMVNLMDYNVGADKGGAVNMFDDFDIDYNQQKYLIETRCSGALVKPFSAIAIESTPAVVG